MGLCRAVADENKLSRWEFYAELIGRDIDRLKARTREILGGNVKRGEVPSLWDGKAAERITDHLVS